MANDFPFELWDILKDLAVLSPKAGTPDVQALILHIDEMRGATTTKVAASGAYSPEGIVIYRERSHRKRGAPAKVVMYPPEILDRFPIVVNEVDFAKKCFEREFGRNTRNYSLGLFLAENIGRFVPCDLIRDGLKRGRKNASHISVPVQIANFKNRLVNLGLPYEIETIYLRIDRVGMGMGRGSSYKAAYRLVPKKDVFAVTTDKLLMSLNAMDAEAVRITDELQAGIRDIGSRIDALEGEVEALDLPDHFPQEGPGEVISSVGLKHEDVSVVDSDFLKRFTVLPGAETAALDVEKLFWREKPLMIAKRTFLKILAGKFGCFIFDEDINVELAASGIDVNGFHTATRIFNSLHGGYSRFDELPYALERIYVLVNDKKKPACRLIPKIL